MHPPGHGGALTRLQDVIEGALPVRAIAPAWAYCCAVESESSTVAETFFGVETWLRCCYFCFFFKSDYSL